MDVKGQLKEGRPTKNEGETVSAVGVTWPQIPDTYWNSTLQWQALGSCIFVYGLFSLLFTKISFSLFQILFYFLFIHITTHCLALPRRGVSYIANMDRNFVLFGWGLPLCKLWNCSYISILNCGTK